MSYVYNFTSDEPAKEFKTFATLEEANAYAADFVLRHSNGVPCRVEEPLLASTE